MYNEQQLQSRRPHSNHKMTRRSYGQHYTAPGFYHVTLRASSELLSPFGRVVGSVDTPQGNAGFPHVELSLVGAMVERELLNSIPLHYPMVKVDTYVVMPEHIHALLHVTSSIVSQHGSETHLGQIIAGFKKGCNRHYWELLQQGKPAATSYAGPASASPACAESTSAGSASSAPTCASRFAREVSDTRGSVRPPSNGTSGRSPLFAPQYTDVIPLTAAEVEQKRSYIRQNPRSRLIRSQHRDWLQPKRAAVDTALTPAGALYLPRQGRPKRQGRHRRCAPAQTAPSAPLSSAAAPSVCASRFAREVSQLSEASPAPRLSIRCDSYGDRALLQRRLLPVVCHRKDAARRAAQKAACLQAAAEGAVLVSARISKDEQDIMDAAQAAGALYLPRQGRPKRQGRHRRCAPAQTAPSAPLSSAPAPSVGASRLAREDTHPSPDSITPKNCKI